MASTRRAPEYMNSAAVEDLKEKKERTGDGSRRRGQETGEHCGGINGRGQARAVFPSSLQGGPVHKTEAVLHEKKMCNKVSGLHMRQSALGG